MVLDKPVPEKKVAEKAPPAPVKEEKKKEAKQEKKQEPPKKESKKEDEDDDDDDDDDDNDKKDHKKPENKAEVKPIEKPKAAPKPTEASKPAPKKPVEKPKSAEASKPTPKSKKAKSPTPATVGGKFIVPVGEGGCRGNGWNKAPYPVDTGRKTIEECGKACLENSCTAFHVLHEDDGKYDCFLFGHKDVLAVKMLGGECKTLSTSASASGEEEDDEDEEEVEVNGPVHMAHLGKGMCRGNGWTFKKWPAVKGFLSAQGCADACARKKGCTAFDLSEQQPDKTFDCTLYGHRKVEPASGVPGNCYVLSDKHGVVPGDVGAAAAEEETEVELEVKGDVDFHMLGKGRCRGPGWTSKKFPAIKGKSYKITNWHTLLDEPEFASFQ